MVVYMLSLILFIWRSYFRKTNYRNYSNLTFPLINAHRPFLARIVICFPLILLACPKFLVIYFALIINAQPNLQQKVYEQLKTTTLSSFSVSILIFLRSTKWKSRRLLLLHFPNFLVHLSYTICRSQHFEPFWYLRLQSHKPQLSAWPSPDFVLDSRRLLSPNLPFVSEKIRRLQKYDLQRKYWRGWTYPLLESEAKFTLMTGCVNTTITLTKM